MITSRGFGEGGTGVISRGHGVFGIAAIDDISRHTSQAVKRVTKESLRIAEDLVDIYKITAMILAVNGDEIIYPKSKTVQGGINRDKEIIVSIHNFAASNVYKPVYKIVISVLKVIKGIK